MKKGTLLFCVMMVLAIITLVSETHAYPGQVTIGTGTNTCSYPYLTFWMDGKTDMLYTAAELNGNGGTTGYITGLMFNVSTANPYLMNGFKIKVQATTKTSLTGFTNSGWTEVYSGTYFVPGTGWREVPFTTPFNWNGTSNLLVEICFNNNSYTSYSYVYGTTMGTTMAVYQYTDLPTNDGCTYFTTGTPTTNRPNIRLNMNVQPPVGILQGTVTNCCSNTPVIGATISCQGLNITTGAGGTYTIAGITPGTYTANCTFPPSYLLTSAQVTVNSNQTTIQDFCLNPDPPLYIYAGTNQMAYLGYPPAACATLSWSGASGGTPPYTFQWNTGETSNTINVCPTVSTIYYVTITDANNCTYIDKVKVCVTDIRCGNQNDLGKKVTVCHFPPGNRQNPQTICIDTAAVQEHLTIHGDLLGPCDIIRTCPD